MKLRNILYSIPILAVTGMPVAADIPLGLWQSVPDRRGVVVHVRTKPCGGAICGQIERAKDLRGYDTPFTDLGRRMLLDMQIQPDGSYAGQIWQPHHGRLMTAQMRVQGNVMQLRNCDGDVCEEVVWKRLR